MLSVAFNDSLVQIGDYAFAECDLLTEINVSKSVRTIGEGAFYCSEGSSLNNVNFDKALALRVIKDKAFYGAEAVRGIALPSTLEELGSAVFGGCKLLGEITAMNSGFFTVVNGGLYSADKKILYAYPALYGAEGGSSSASVYNPEISIDPTCSRILSGAFSYTKISSVIIKSSLKVDEGAFYCPTLRRVYIDAEKAEMYSGSFAFEPSIILNAEKMSAEKQEEIKGRFPGRVSVYDKDEWEGVRDFENNYIYELYKYTDTVNGNTVIKDGVRILGSRQSSPQLHIPSTLSNYSVTAIADYAFYGDNTIEKVYLPSDLRVIGKKAFGNMSKLDEVTFNDVVEEIGDYAFADSKNLSSINYGDGMTKVVSFGAGVFENTAFIEDDNHEFITVGNVLVKYTGFSTAVEIPDDIGYIASDAFVNHGEITSVEFGDSLSIIDSRAFQYCEGIKEIFLPSSVRIIREYAFYNCSDLFSVNFGVSKTDSALSVDENAFYGVYSESGAVLVYTDSEQFTITYRIDSSDSYSSRGVAIVKAHTVDNSTRNRFAGWYEDEALTVPAKFPRKLEENVTVYAKWIGINESSVGIVYRLTEDDTYAVSGYEGTDTYVIVPDTYMGKSIKEIDDRAFYGKNVLSIELPNNKNYDGSMSSQLNIIGEDAFADTGWYESYSGDFVMIDDFLVKYKGKSSVVYIPDNVHKIAKGAFKNNGYIEKVVFSEGVSELADEIFYGCVSLKEAVLPKGLLTIGRSVFSGCTELSDINFSDCKNLSSIGYDAFDGTEWLNGYVDPCVMINTTLYRYKGNMRSLHIYNGVTSIGERAFYGNVALKNVYIPQSVTNIGESAFENSAVEEVNLYAGGSKLSLIQKRAFYNAAYLTVLDLSLAPGLGYIGEYAFYGCKQLKTVEIPAGTANMGAHAFEESGINSVTFASGSKLTAIADYAFNSCKSLHKVNFVGASSLTSIGDYAFYNCISLEYFDNGKGKLTSIGDYAFYGCSSLSKFYINEETLAEIGDKALESVGYSTSEQGFVVLGNILLGYDGYETEVTIPDNITTIYNGAFAGNTRVKKVIFGSKSAITNVNSEAFRDCANLKEINFPDSIRFVGDDVVTGTAWYNDQVRDGKEFIVIANTLIKYNGSEVKRVVIPQEIGVINRGAFDGCAVFDVCIGENVLTIE
ncbi:MAG: leucine-rich repeat protein, partial [Christensenellales bacterium]